MKDRERAYDMLSTSPKTKDKDVPKVLADLCTFLPHLILLRNTVLNEKKVLRGDASTTRWL